MTENPDQIQVSEDDMKEALSELINIKFEDWTHTHDVVLEEYKKVKNDIISGKIPDGKTIEETKEDFKRMYAISKKIPGYRKVHNIKFAIKYVADGKGSKRKIETIYRGKNKDLQNTIWNIEDIIGENRCIYIITVAIICE